MTVTWYLATCFDCTPRLPQPFLERGERDRWANAHIDATGHRILIETEHR